MKIRPDFGFWIAVMLIATGVVYLLVVNSLSTQGYEIKRLEQKLAAVKDQRASLEIEAASLKSIQQMDIEIKNLNLVPSQNMKYLPGNGFSYK